MFTINKNKKIITDSLSLSIEIDKTCNFTNPCSHVVKITTSTKTYDIKMKAPEIVNFIFQNNLFIDYGTLKHFENHFTTNEQHELLSALKEEAYLKWKIKK